MIRTVISLSLKKNYSHSFYSFFLTIQRPYKWRIRFRTGFWNIIWVVSILVHTVSTWGDELKFIPSISIREEYVDNIFWSSMQKTGDTITILSPGLELDERTERSVVEISGKLNCRTYGSNHELDAIDHTWLGKINHYFSQRASFSSEAKFVKDSMADQDMESSGILLGTIERDRYHAGLSGNYQLSELTFASISYAYDQDDYDETDILDEAVSDAKGNSIYFNISSDLSTLVPTLIGQLTVNSARYTFSNQTLDKFSLLSSEKLKLNENLDVNVGLGVFYTRSVFPITQFDFTSFRFITLEQSYEKQGWISNIALSYQGEKIFTKLAYIYDVQPASGRNGATQRENLKLEISCRITYKLWTYLNMNYYLNKANAFELAGKDINEETLSVAPTIRYDFTKKLAVEAACGYAVIRDRVKRRTINRNNTSIKLSYQYELLK